MASTRWSARDSLAFSKKHDAPPQPHPPTSRGLSWIGLRRRRILLPLLALLGIYVFVKNIPTNLAPVGQRTNSVYGSMAPGHVLANAPIVQGGGSGAQHGGEQEYEGSIQFPNLAKSLRPHLSLVNQNNVLFVVPELGSASNLLPFACQMSRNNRSSVHLALLGRQDVGVKDILKVNGINEEDCPVFWHDARPDHPLESSFGRLAASIQAGLGHCCTALRPQLILVDEVAGRDVVLGGLLREVATGTGVPLSILPRNVLQSVPWMTTLDGTSLRRMKDIEIEIVIQANDNSAGPLIRLLHSIHNANYDGLFYPRLTIELPAQIDPFLSNFLQSFRWPPGSSPTESQLTLRHRIQTRKLKAVETSLHTLESFYPRTTTSSHVLLLASDAELSSDYLHYLMLTLLEYKYGQDNNDMADSIFGISLEMPGKALNDEPLRHGKAPSKEKPLMLWQAPNIGAALITGDKWIELRKFLAHRLAGDPELKIKSKPEHPVSTNYPSWLVEVLDLMQARGQYMIYPAFASGDSNSKLVTLHQELLQPPEEYIKTMEEEEETLELSVDEILHSDVLTDVTKRPRTKEPNVLASASAAFQELISPKGKNSLQRLPLLKEMPMFAYDGTETDWYRSQSTSKNFADEFSQRQGGCTSLDSRDKTKIGSIDYVFCDIG